MDSDTLHTASAYLNNLLLARGLLRDSKQLDFAKPTRETRAQIINLVHDLLLRRDREQDNREQIALTVRTLRADQTRKDGDLEKLQLRLDERERSLLQAQTEARNTKIEMRRLESATRALQDQLARLKASVTQIKTQCANDVRKRDMHIERLKSHLQGQQRGNKGGLVAPSISVTGRGVHSLSTSVKEIDDPEYNLKQETTEFLTQLSSGLSDENDALIEMIRGTLFTLRELLGVPEHGYDSTIGSVESEDGALGFAHASLGEELESMIQMLRTVLTNPNFVSMDEVEARDEEISRLREGWDKMETRWRELLLMMNGWCTRMERSGDTINLDDLRKGLGLGLDLDPPPTAQQAHASRRMPDGGDDDDSRNLSPSPSERQPPPSTAKSHRSINPPEFFSVKPRTLSNMSHNVQSPRKVTFVDDTMENVDPAETYAKLDTPTIVKSSVRRSPISTLANAQPLESSDDYLHQLRSFSPPQLSVESPSKDSMRPEDDGHPTLSVQEKLRLAQAEAEAAATKASVRQTEEDSQLDFEINEEIGKLRSPVKKTRIQGRPKRRKSTLSPEELEDLLGLE